MSDSHTRWSEQLAPYLLGSLPAEEADAVEAHVEGCESCREEVRWLRPALEVLPESVEPIEPSPALRERIMAEVREGAAEPAAAPARPRARRGGLRGFMLRPAVGLAATAVVGAGALGYLVHGGGEGGSTTTVPGPGASAMLERASRTLELTGLRQPPAGKGYEAWVGVGRQVQPAAWVQPAADGTARVRLRGSLAHAKTVMVTLESKGASQPTGDPVVNLRLP